MKHQFDTRFKHLWPIIVSGPASSGKTVVTKHVLNKTYKEFEKDIGYIPNSKTDTKNTRESALCRAGSPLFTHI